MSLNDSLAPPSFPTMPLLLLSVFPIPQPTHWFTFALSLLQSFLSLTSILSPQVEFGVLSHGSKTVTGAILLAQLRLLEWLSHASLTVWEIHYRHVTRLQERHKVNIPKQKICSGICIRGLDRDVFKGCKASARCGHWWRLRDLDAIRYASINMWK